MNKILEESLVKLIEKSISGIDAATGFLQAEVPEYITQLITWYAIYNFLMFVLGIVILVSTVLISIKFTGKKKNKEGEFVWTLTHDDDGDPSAHIMVSAIVFSIALVVGFASINLKWLQIWIAPKVWLIEYAAKIAS